MSKNRIIISSQPDRQHTAGPGLTSIGAETEIIAIEAITAESLTIRDLKLPGGMSSAQFQAIPACVKTLIANEIIYLAIMKRLRNALFANRIVLRAYTSDQAMEYLPENITEVVIKAKPFSFNEFITPPWVKSLEIEGIVTEKLLTNYTSRHATIKTTDPQTPEITKMINARNATVIKARNITDIEAANLLQNMKTVPGTARQLVSVFKRRADSLTADSELMPPPAKRQRIDSESNTSSAPVPPPQYNIVDLESLTVLAFMADNPNTSRLFDMRQKLRTMAPAQPASASDPMDVEFQNKL